MPGSNFHGAFVFRNQGYGILSSTYFNNDDPRPYPETAILKENGDETDPFIGKFETVWLERNDQHTCWLTITKNSKNQHAYDLRWEGGTPSIKPYNGLGIMEGEIMVGCYWGA